jgi:hypothetical protein
VENRFGQKQFLELRIDRAFLIQVEIQFSMMPRSPVSNFGGEVI